MNGFGDRKYSLINYIKNKIDKINHKSHRLKDTSPEEIIFSIKVYSQ